MIPKKSIKLTLGDEERTFYFGLGFLGMFFDNSDSTLESLQDDIRKNPFKILPELMYYSLRYGYERKGETANFNQYDVSDWIDDIGGVKSDLVLSFISTLTKSMDSGLPKEKGVKKKKEKVSL